MIRPRELHDDDAWETFRATRDGDLERVRALVARRPELALVEYNYTPPIHFAVREGHLELVRFFLDRGADPAYRTYPFSDSLLTMARDRDHHHVAELLLELATRRFPVREGLEAFLEAAKRGDLEFIRSELARDPSLARASNDVGDTALHRAADGGHLEVLTTLLDAGANADAANADGVRPINRALRPWLHPPLHAGVLAGTLLAHGAAYNVYIAAVLGDTEYVRTALARDPSLANFEDSSHYYPISAAARRNDLEMVRLLLDAGANPSLPEEGAPLGGALWIAVYQKQREMAKLLLEHGANPDTAPESSGPAILHTRKDPDLRQLLLDYGAKDDDPPRADPLQRLLEENDLVGLESELAKRKAIDPDAFLFWGEGVIAGPARDGRRDVVEMLLRLGARVPDVSKWGRFYYFKHTEIVSALLELGANPNHMNWHHFTMLHHMAADGDVEKARLLIDHGADVNAVDEEYRSTPLGCAARWGQREMAALLLERGADPNLAGAPWATPLAWARKNGHAEIEAELMAAQATDVRR